jgi:zeaxanthin glucosyltransferase
MNGAFDELLQQLGADLFIVSTFLQTDILILYYKYHITPAIFTSFLREEGISPAVEYCDYLSRVSPEEVVAFLDFVIAQGIRLESVAQLAAPLDSFCELVVVPRELDINTFPLSGNVCHIEPSVRKGGAGQDIRRLYGIAAGKPIVYASLGSQPVRHRETGGLFFEKVIEAMQSEELQDSHLIVSIGPEFQTDRLGTTPANVTLLRWAPQIDILKMASLAIIHGGMGTVKECIFYGVPMIIFPLAFDQPSNANRVEYHKLGLQAGLENITTGELRSMIRQVRSSDEIRAGIKRMQSIFIGIEDAQPGADIIERLLQAK